MIARARATVGAGLVVLAGAAACGGSDGGSGPPDQHLWTVLVRSDAGDVFQPVQLSIAPGDTVVWAWFGTSALHNVLSTGSPSFESKGTDAVPGALNTDYFSSPPAVEHRVVFETPGTYQYYCSAHGSSAGTGMHGTVTVD
jgi:plastocyanin